MFDAHQKAEQKENQTFDHIEIPVIQDCSEFLYLIKQMSFVCQVFFAIILFMRKFNFATSRKKKHFNATHAIVMSLMVSNISNIIIIALCDCHRCDSRVISKPKYPFFYG